MALTVIVSVVTSIITIAIVEGLLRIFGHSLFEGGK